MSEEKFVSNPDLQTILPANEWKGTPLDEKGLFKNLHHPFAIGFRQVLKWQREKNPFKEQKKTELWQPEIVKDGSFLSNDKDCLVWLGHASFFIRINGVSLLIDPVFGKLPMMKRYTDLPVDPYRFTNLDYLLISHNHRDHCDKDSYRLVTDLNPRAKVLTGLRNEELLGKWSPKQRIESAGWFQQYNLGEQDLKITYLPTRHWSRRYLHDTNRHLWGAFMIESEGKTIYFGGDSGYSNHFKQTAELFPEIDVAMLGIGAFYPEWFMSASHTSPAEAINAFHDLGAHTFIPMHYGTFDLADEPLSEPLRRINQMQANGEIKKEVRLLKVGEAY